ncbi:DUF1993 domain-containing protein [soil metagenome]
MIRVVPKEPLMSLSMYEVSIAQIDRAFKQLLVFLDKGEAHAAATGEPPGSFIECRLAADMLPLSAQVQIATDIAKGCGARLAGVEVPSYADDEKTFAELKARIEKTLAFLHSLDRAAIDASADRDIALSIRKQPMLMQGRDYLLAFVLPNLYFHVTTTYALLRHKGVVLGKLDYLGPYGSLARPA